MNDVVHMRWGRYGSCMAVRILQHPWLLLEGSQWSDSPKANVLSIKLSLCFTAAVDVQRVPGIFFWSRPSKTNRSN
jgi:hypothetical protein